jgi:peptide/nickel transport system permease protein
MGLRAYVAKRLVYTIVLVFFVATLNFLIFQLLPGEPTRVLADAGRLTPDKVAQIRALYGLDQDIWTRYVKYVYNIFTFQLGFTYRDTSATVAEQIAARLPNTLALVGLSTVLALVIGTFMGVFAAARRGGVYDNASVFSSLFFYSLPSFWLGLIFIFIFNFQLHWFPVGGAYPPTWVSNPCANILCTIQGRLYHLALPVMVLTIFQYGGYLLLTRATMMESLTEDYITTARAKGLKNRTVLFKHALKNASLPLITNAALSMGFVLGGAIITETVFNYQGLGLWIYDAIGYKDFPSMQGIFYIIALTVIAANFLSDVLLGVIDPRIKYS